MRRNVVVAVLLWGVTVPGFAGAQAPDPRPGPSTPVTVVNTAPIPVTVPGGITVSGNVNIANAPSVNVANTPSVTVTNTPNVNVSNSPTVQSVQSGTWNVGVTSPVSLTAGAKVAAVPTIPQQPYVFHSDSGAAVRVFGPAPPTMHVALTTVIFANQDPGAPWFITVFSDDCAGTNKVEYLAPLVPATSTFVAAFPSPLVIGAAGTWCLNVLTPTNGGIYPYTLVGFVP